MSRLFHGLADYWYVVALIAGAVLLWLVTGGRRSIPSDTIKREMAAIRAGAEAREKQIQLGRHRAARDVRKAHAVAIARLKDQQATKAEELRNDPVALSKFLVRAGRPDA